MASAAMTLAATRLLQAADDPSEEDPCAAGAPEVSGLRIAGVFILFACSAAGVLPSLLGKLVAGPAVTRAITLCKTVGTGVVLSCALIHMLLPGVESLASECVPASVREDYPALAYLVALCAGLAMHFIETMLSSGEGGGHQHHHHHQQPQPQPLPQPKQHVHSDSSRLLGNAAVHPAYYSCMVVKAEAEAPKATALAAVATEAPCEPGHHHHAATVACETNEVRIVSSDKLVNLVLVELGFSIHSVFVGLAVANAAEDDFRGLLAAICFHQLFEGLALSARLSATGLSWRRDLIFGAVFSLSGPLGMALGLFAVSASASLNSGGYLVTQGVLDSVGAGIMLYLGFSMLIIDFPVDVAALCDHSPSGAAGKRTSALMRASMFGALWAGVIGMAVLGKYL
jgi:zinc transporter 1/2/3